MKPSITEPFPRYSGSLAKSPKDKEKIRDFIPIRSLSYQKKLNPLFNSLNDPYKTFSGTADSRSGRPNLTFYQHKINKGRGLIHTADSTAKPQFSRISVGTSGSKRIDALSTNYDLENNGSNELELSLGGTKKQFFTNFMHTQETIPKVRPTDELIPDENEIREQYRLKLPVLVSQHENDSTYIHFMEAYPHTIEFLENLLSDAWRLLNRFKQEKEELADHIEEMKKHFDKEISDIQLYYKKEFEVFSNSIKEDFVSRQNENFRLQKEITLLNRDKYQLEQEIDKTLLKIRRLEGKLFGLEMYELTTEDKFINDLTLRNLRSEFSNTIKTKTVFH